MANRNEAEAQLYDHTNRLLQSHEVLLSDKYRNSLIYRALRKTVRRRHAVLDIGSGTGVWAIAAAKLGARRVVAIEQDPLLIGLIKQTAVNNGVADRVEVIQGDSRQIQLAREFDVVISETIGYLVFDESIVSIMVDARERFLKPGGALIPDSVALVVAGARLKSRNERAPAGVPINQEYFASLEMNIPVGLKDARQLRLLTEPAELIRIDLKTSRGSPELENLVAHWKLEDASEINCFAVWGELLLARGVVLSTRKTSSWPPMIYRVRKFGHSSGELEFGLSLTAETNYWTATLTSEAEQEIQKCSPAFAAAELLARTRTDKDVFAMLALSQTLKLIQEKSIDLRPKS